MGAMATSAPSRVTPLIALLCALVLLATACGGDDSGGGASTETTAPADGATTTTAVAGEAASETPAANVRADLTALLEEQVYLTGLTVEAAVGAGGRLDAPAPVAVAATADESATELSEVIGTAYGVVAGVDFLEVWNVHRQAIVDYALAGGSVATVDQARAAVVDQLDSLEPEGAFEGVAEGLQVSDELLLATVDELVAEEPAAAADLRLAADEMPSVALVIAGTIATQNALEGEVDSDEATTRAELTGLFQESGYLTGLALEEIVLAGGDPAGPDVQGVLGALDINTADLAAVMEPDDAVAAGEFEALWAGHIDDFVDYTVAQFEGDAPGIAAAEDALDQFRDEMGNLLATRYPAFTTAAVAEELVPHVDTMLAYADAVVAGAEVDGVPTAPALLRDAALALRATARTIAAGITVPA